eukprot:CAMPEP_0194509536 /NCGR_PEP_ID=MMETSP0253-20130528/40408_1 /TAXON_ID=2966 /ORGANISM="Noctiluca scintillans" /LENGTH=84 /DNA_ID=CAMNT_0039352697 /DNA_START=31 /DNA_END=283 /DNA_ORIENTATION=-
MKTAKVWHHGAPTQQPILGPCAGLHNSAETTSRIQSAEEVSETVHVKAHDHGSDTLLDYAPPQDRTCAAIKPHRRNGKAKRGGD